VSVSVQFNGGFGHCGKVAPAQKMRRPSIVVGQLNINQILHRAPIMSLLSSLKVLDFSTLLPGPYASMILADHGAEVLRIESPTRQDLARQLPPFDKGTSTAHAYLNRSKQSLALDLKQSESIEIVKSMVAEYDIVLEQFRPGVMDRLGLGYEALKEINPGLIYCSITGFGQTGPYRSRPGHDINYLAIAGVSSYTGRRGQGPLPLGVQLADLAGGSLHSVIGILSAVINRQLTGEGQHIDISMTDAALALNAMSGSAAVAAGAEPGLETELLNGGSFYDYYETSDGRYMAVGGLEPQFMQALCEALGCPDLVATGLSPKPDDQQRFKRYLRCRFSEQSFEYWRELFDRVEACVEPVLTLQESLQHPQMQAREMLVEVPDGQNGVQPQLAQPIRYSGSQASYRHIGRSLGEDSDRVLQELGLSPEQIAGLRERGVTV